MTIYNFLNTNTGDIVGTFNTDSGKVVQTGSTEYLTEGVVTDMVGAEPSADTAYVDERNEEIEGESEMLQTLRSKYASTPLDIVETD